MTRNLTDITKGFWSQSQPLLLIVIASAILILTSATGQGDVVWLKGKGSPVFGRIESESDQGVQIRVFEDGRFGPKTWVPRDQIEASLINIDANRLTQLDPSKPDLYRDYAEELAAQKNDPAAKALAQRLYLLAAANANHPSFVDGTRDVELRRSALLGLASLANSAAERRRIEVFRYLVDPDSSDDRLLAIRDDSASPTTNAQKQQMLELVHVIRREQTERAVQLLSQPENRKVFEGWREFCSLAELDQMATVNRPSQVQLSKLLAIELQIVRDVKSASESRRWRATWGDYAVQESNRLGLLPTIDNISRFDPKKSVYRDGTWVEPIAK